MYIVDPIKCYLIGCSAIIVSVYSHSKKKKRLKQWLPTIGSVHDIRRDRDGDATVRMRFTDQGGKPRTAAMKVADGDSVSLGAELEISYNPQNPEEAFVRSAKDMNLAFYIPLIGGILVLALGIVSEITLAQAGY